MRQLATMMVIAIAMLFTSINKSAQSNNQQRMSREQLAEKQARHIAHELALAAATTQKYVTTYCAYQKEVWALGPRVKRHQANATEAEAEQANKARMEQSQKILALREKYYKEYSKFLTQKQIERAYELEQQMMRRLARHHHRQSASGTGSPRRTSRNR